MTFSTKILAGPTKPCGRGFEPLGCHTQINWQLSSTRSNGCFALPNSNSTLVGNTLNPRYCQPAKRRRSTKREVSQEYIRFESKRNLLETRSGEPLRSPVTTAVPPRRNTIGYVFSVDCDTQSICVCLTCILAISIRPQKSIQRSQRNRVSFFRCWRLGMRRGLSSLLLAVG